jgi:hypothetical protein
MPQAHLVRLVKTAPPQMVPRHSPPPAHPLSPPLLASINSTLNCGVLVAVVVAVGIILPDITVVAVVADHICYLRCPHPQGIIIP